MRNAGIDSRVERAVIVQFEWPVFILYHGWGLEATQVEVCTVAYS